MSLGVGAYKFGGRAMHWLNANQTRPINWQYIGRMRSLLEVKSFQRWGKYDVRIRVKIVKALDHVTMSWMCRRWFLALGRNTNGLSRNACNSGSVWTMLTESKPPRNSRFAAKVLSLSGTETEVPVTMDMLKICKCGAAKVAINCLVIFGLCCVAKGEDIAHCSGKVPPETKKVAVCCDKLLVAPRYLNFQTNCLSCSNSLILLLTRPSWHWRLQWLERDHGHQQQLETVEDVCDA